MAQGEPPIDGPTYARRAGHPWRAHAGTILVMGPDRRLHQLAGGAARAWLLLWSPATASELVARDADEPSAAGAVDEAARSLELLHADGLVARVR